MSERKPSVYVVAAPLAIFAGLAAMVGCQTPSSRAKALQPAAPVAAPAPLDPSFDWHVLVIAPFGSVLKDVPRTLHEVLLFRDQDPGAAPADDGECYAADAPVPQFMGRVPDDYMLCFKQDRLSRIQASVRLPGSEVAAMFAAACDGWRKNAVTWTAASTAASAAAPTVARAVAPVPSDAQNADACEGRDGAIHFSAHLVREPETALSITLDGAVGP